MSITFNTKPFISNLVKKMLKDCEKYRNCLEKGQVYVCFLTKSLEVCKKYLSIGEGKLCKTLT